MKTTGYFFDASKLGGLINQYCTGAPPAPGTVRLSGAENVTSLSQLSFSRVSGVALSPASETRNRSVGLVIVFLPITMKLSPTSRPAMAPPLVTTLGVPAGNATE